MRRLSNMLAGIALVLWIAVLCLWVRSDRHVDLVGYVGGKGLVSWQRGGFISSGAAVFHCEWWLRQNDPRDSSGPQGWSYTTWTISALFPAGHGFEYHVGTLNIARTSDD